MRPWLRFIKYKLSLAVTLTGTAGYLIYSGAVDINLLFTAFGIYLLAGGASGFNQYQERYYDSRMDRTRDRPIPSGLIKPKSALIVSLILIVSGATLLFRTGLLPAILGLLNVAFYNLLYTRLKRITYLAIIPGAIVGAIPPLIGWTAAGGLILSPTAIFLSMLIFMWQIPHFWLLIIKYHKEYEKAGFKTVLKLLGEKQVKRMVFIWITVSSLFAMTYFYFGISIDIVFSYLILTVNILFILLFYYLLFRAQKDISKAFVLSNIFITTYLIILTAASLI